MEGGVTPIDKHANPNKSIQDSFWKKDVLDGLNEEDVQKIEQTNSLWELFYVLEKCLKTTHDEVQLIHQLAEETCFVKQQRMLDKLSGLGVIEETVHRLLHEVRRVIFHVDLDEYITSHFHRATDTWSKQKFNNMITKLSLNKEHRSLLNQSWFLIIISMLDIEHLDTTINLDAQQIHTRVETEHINHIADVHHLPLEKRPLCLQGLLDIIGARGEKGLRHLYTNARPHQNSQKNYFDIKRTQMVDAQFDALGYLDHHSCFVPLDLPKHLIENFQEQVLKADYNMMNNEEEGYDCTWFVKNFLGENEFKKRRTGKKIISPIDLHIGDIIKFFRFPKDGSKLDFHWVMCVGDGLYLSKIGIGLNIMLATREQLEAHYDDAFVFREK